MSGITNEQLAYETGKLYLGHRNGNEVGIKTERHAITVAGARSGKGACVIIPNLLRWPDNVLVIDPKGENAEKTWQARQKLGSKIYIIDPFETADVPAHLRASFNPLEGIDPNSLTGSADLEVIADGLVKRADPKHAQWDDGAVTLLSGLMAYVISEAPEESKTLKSVRDILIQDRDDLYADGQRMKGCEAFDGIAQDAGSIITDAFDNDKGMEADFLSAARRHIKWINLQAMRNVLEKSTFSLSELKTGKASIYMVLPPEYLKSHSAFLRLFTLMAINAMAKGGSGKGKKCLFLLDEFFSLGKIEVVSTASGLMPSYGVHLWPFLQDLGQLIGLYGKEGAESFFANSDVHQFFGNTDPLTLEQISTRLGVKNMDEVPLPPPAPSSYQTGIGQGISGMASRSTKSTYKVLGGLAGAGIGMAESLTNANAQKQYQDDINAYQRKMAEHGRQRMTPDEVAMRVQKKDDVVADKMVCFVFGSEPVWLSLAPYFRKLEPVPTAQEPSAQESSPFTLYNIYATAMILVFWLGGGQIGWEIFGGLFGFIVGGIAGGATLFVIDHFGILDSFEEKYIIDKDDEHKN